MKVKIEAIIDLGDDFVDIKNPAEVSWAEAVVQGCSSVRVGDDVADDFPIRVVGFGVFYDY
jgi:hypothetical protein